MSDLDELANAARRSARSTAPLPGVEYRVPPFAIIFAAVFLGVLLAGGVGWVVYEAHQDRQREMARQQLRERLEAAQAAINEAAEKLKNVASAESGEQIDHQFVWVNTFTRGDGVEIPGHWKRRTLADDEVELSPGRVYRFVKR